MREEGKGCEMWEEGKGEQTGPREQTVLATVVDIDRSIEGVTSKKRHIYRRLL